VTPGFLEKKQKPFWLTALKLWMTMKRSWSRRLRTSVTLSQRWIDNDSRRCWTNWPASNPKPS